jgi:hypothetical protein
MPTLIVNLRMVSRLYTWPHVCPSMSNISSIDSLFCFAEENHLEVVKFLLANGANQSLATEVRENMFMFAVVHAQ